MNKAHEVQILAFSDSIMKMKVDGKDYEIDLADQSQRLAKASQAQREHVEISPAGCGLRWPDVDEDLSVDGLVGVSHQAPLFEIRSKR